MSFQRLLNRESSCYNMESLVCTSSRNKTQTRNVRLRPRFNFNRKICNACKLCLNNNAKLPLLFCKGKRHRFVVYFKDIQTAKLCLLYILCIFLQLQATFHDGICLIVRLYNTPICSTLTSILLLYIPTNPQ